MVDSLGLDDFEVAYPETDILVVYLEAGYPVVECLVVVYLEAAYLVVACLAMFVEAYPEQAYLDTVLQPREAPLVAYHTVAHTVAAAAAAAELATAGKAGAALVARSHAFVSSGPSSLLL